MCRAPSFTFTAEGDPDIVVNRKVDAVDKSVVILRTCGVRAINPDTGKTTLAYAKLDTASQATLISEKICKELSLKRNANVSTLIRTLEEGTTKCNGHFDFELISLFSNEKFMIKGALTLFNFVDDESQNTRFYKNVTAWT